MEQTVTIFILIYLLTILLSATRRVSMSVAALIGALLTAWFGLQYGVFTYDQAKGFIDMKLLALLIGTMIVVEVAERGGLFRFGALYAIKLSRGNPAWLFVVVCVSAAAASMFLGDPTAMLLVAAATGTITKLLEYDPVPYFISAAMMVNLGGTSTLIGSTSNMVIGIEAGLKFTEFISYLALCEFALWGLTVLGLYMIFRSRLGTKKTLPPYDPWKRVENKSFFFLSIFVLVLLLLLFLTVENLGVGPEVIALGCAIVALVLSNVNPVEIFKGLDWETVFFVAGFMFIVNGLEKTGFLSNLSNHLFQISGGNTLTSTLAALWISGIGSTIVSNTAIALTFTPIISGLKGVNSAPLWSALVLGTNFGGATTPLSGSVCILAISMLKREGITLNFTEFTKVGVVISLIQLGFSSLYLVLRFGLLVR